MKYYTGIGSRQTPEWACKFMSNIATRLAMKGYILRSGGADGADTAFEKDAVFNGQYEIFLPWNGFNTRKEDNEHYFALDSLGKMNTAKYIASTIHPAWESLSEGAKKLHARNCHQILGKDLESPSAFVIYYAVQNEQGEITGGTRTAVELARRYKIKEYNLFTYSGIKGVINDLW